VSKKNP